MRPSRWLLPLLASTFGPGLVVMACSGKPSTGAGAVLPDTTGGGGTAGAGGAGGAGGTAGSGGQAGNGPDGAAGEAGTGGQAGDAGVPEAGGDGDAADGATSNCADAGPTCGITLSAASAAIAADGLSTDLITITVDKSAATQPVELSISGPGTFKESGAATYTVTTDAAGHATATFVSDATGGTATITGIIQGQPSGASLTIDMPVLANATVESIQYNLMGVKYSGYNEQNQIVFDLFGPNSTPYPPGLTVTLEHTPLGGSTIGTPGSPPVPTCNTPGCKVTTSGITDTKGHVTVTLYSGTVAGTTDVSIAASAGSATQTLTTAPIAIVGAKSNGANIALTCNPRNVAALVNTDCTKSLVDTQVYCTVTLGDRFNNAIGIPKVASFASEAGVVGPPQSTPQYPDPKIGQATGYINTKGGQLPLDVPPVAAEQPFVQTFDDGQCGSRTHNPRDGIVSVIVMTQGEEGFIDQNGDGVFNPGQEPFIDVAEPFVDSNDNGVRDLGEYFLDVNSNQQWDGPNGTWDSSTTIWAETRIVYSGPAYFIGFEDSANNPLASYDVPKQTSATVYPFASDENFSVLAVGSTYGLGGTTGPMSAQLVGNPPMIPARPEGFFFKQAFCDAASPTTCASVCPPSAQATRCLAQSSLNSFEGAVGGQIQLSAGAPVTPTGYSVTFVANTPSYGPSIASRTLTGMVN